MRRETDALTLANPARIAFLTARAESYEALLRKFAAAELHPMIEKSVDDFIALMLKEGKQFDGIIIDLKTPGLDASKLFAEFLELGVVQPVMLLDSEGGETSALRGARGMRLASDDFDTITAVAYCGVASKQREREWKSHVERLENEAEARAANLETARAQLEENYRHLQQAQGQLLQNEKLACVGQISAGIAHEINNPIGFVYSNMSTLKDYVDIIRQLGSRLSAICEALRDGKEEEAVKLAQESDAWYADKDVSYIMEDIESLVNESIEGAERVKRIVMDLRTFCRTEPERRTTADINKGIESTINLCWNELKYRCEVVKELGDIPEIACYPTKLNQVFMNLIMNAAQAIREKGIVAIRTYCDSSNIYIQVSDNGIGISKENLTRIFNPFFTTKPVGQGTGLGLSLACKMISDHGGEITAESEEGKGTTFTVRLPLENISDAQPLAAC